MSNVIWTLVEVAANLIESLLCIHFLVRSFNGRIRVLGTRTVYIIGVVCMTAFVTALNKVITYEGMYGLLYAALFFIYSVIFLQGTLLKKIFISVLVDLCLISSAAVSENILFVFFKDDLDRIYTSHSYERIVFMIVGISLLAYVLALLMRFTSGKKESLKSKEWALILSVLGISFFVIAELHMILLDNDIGKKYANLLITVEGCIILINIICLYITFNLSETNRREEELLLEKKQHEYNQKYAQTVKEQYDQTRQLRHDMKQYIVSLSTLIKSHKYNAAIELLNKQSDTLSKVETIIDVDNDFVNAILNTKLTHVKSSGIDVICSIEKNISSIDDMDLCNLLGNMLDNAILAAEECRPESRLIEVKISSAGSRLVILVKNSIPVSVLDTNPDLRSTKKDALDHGFGVKTIRSIAVKYGGRVDFYEEGLTFICRAELKKNI